MVAKNGLDFLPAWYITEKEAFKTIQALTCLKDLVFYLKNPDPFIRRQAIIRVGSLKQKDSYNMLNGIFEDELETDENRLLATLFMQKLNFELGLGFFFSLPFSPELKSNEDLDSMLKISVIDPMPDLRLEFNNGLIESQLIFDNEFLKCNLDENDDILPFSINDWVRRFLPGLFAGMGMKLKNTARLVLKYIFITLPKKLLVFLESILKKPEKQELCIHEPDRTNHSPKPRSVPGRRRTLIYRPSIKVQIKGIFRKLIYIILAPFRLVFHFKWVIIITLAALYCLFSFTVPGKSFLFRINPDAYYSNTEFLNKSKNYAIGLIKSNDTLATLLGPTRIPVETRKPESQVSYKKMVVTATKGLYLRSEPESTGLKLILMEKNTTVEYLNEEKQGENGSMWFKIRLDDETVGWANARYLKEVQI